MKKKIFRTNELPYKTIFVKNRKTYCGITLANVFGIYYYFILILIRWIKL